MLHECGRYAPATALRNDIQTEHGQICSIRDMMTSIVKYFVINYRAVSHASVDESNQISIVLGYEKVFRESGNPFYEGFKRSRFRLRKALGLNFRYPNCIGLRRTSDDNISHT